MTATAPDFRIDLGDFSSTEITACALTPRARQFLGSDFATSATISKSYGEQFVQQLAQRGFSWEVAA